MHLVVSIYFGLLVEHVVFVLVQIYFFYKMARLGKY